MSKASGSIDLKSLKVAGDGASKYITAIDGDGIKIHAENNVDVNYSLINAEGMEIYQGETVSDSIRVAKFGSITTIGEDTGAYLRVENNGISLKDKALSIFQIYTKEIENGPNIDIIRYQNKNTVFGWKDTYYPNSSGGSHYYYPNNYNVVFDDVTMNLGDNINISITWSGRGGVYASGGHYTDYFDYQDLLLSFTYGTALTQEVRKNIIANGSSYLVTIFDVKYDGTNTIQLRSKTDSWYTSSQLTYVNVRYYHKIQVYTTQQLINIPNVIIGAQELGHIKIDYHSLQMIDKEGDAYLQISDLRDISGNLTETFVGDGITTLFTTMDSIQSCEYITINGTETTDYSYSQSNITFTTAPNEGAEIIVYYTPYTTDTKSFIFGTNTNALTIDWNSNITIPNNSAYMSKNSSGDKRRLCYITNANNNIYGYDSYNNNEGGSYLYGNTIGIYSKSNINIGRAADSNTININGTVSGSLNITGQYQRHGNTYIVTDSASVDNKTVYGTSSSNDSYASFEIDAAKTGYDLIGVINYNFSNASSSGTNSSHIMCYGCSFDGTTDKVTIKVRNLTSANAKIKITVRCLYRAQ